MSQFEKTVNSTSYQKYLQSRNNSNRFGNSSFWMDDIITRRDYMGSKKFDIFKMVQYQKVIANFVKIQSKKDIPVVFNSGNQSKTDGKTKVILSADIDDQSFDVTVGLALHEASHISSTDFKYSEKLFRPSMPWSEFVKNGYSIIKDNMPHFNKRYNSYNRAMHAPLPSGLDVDYLFNLVNWVEDRRIDELSFQNSPGYKSYYHALYDKYFFCDIITKGLLSSEYRNEDPMSYLFRIVGLTNPQTDPGALKGLQSIINKLDLHNISRLNNTREAIDLAAGIFDIVAECVQRELEKPQPPQQQDDKNQQQGSDKNQNQKDQKKDSNNQDSSSKSSSSKNEDKEEKGDESVDGHDSSDSKDSTDDSTEKPEDQTEDEKESGKADTKEEEQKDDSTDGSNGEGKPKSNDDSNNHDAPTTGMGQEEEKPKPLSDKELEKLSDAIDEIKSLVSGNLKKTATTQENDAITKEIGGSSDIDIDEVNYNGEKVPVLHVRVSPGYLKKVADKYDRSNSGYILSNIANSEALLAVQQGRMIMSDSDVYGYGASVAEGIRIGTALGHKLQIRDQIRDTKFTRLKSGRIDGRMLHAAGFGSENLFARIEIDKFTPNVLDISIDASGSMGGDKWKKTQTAVLAIAKAASMVQNIQVKISYRHAFSVGSMSSIIFVDAYDSKRDSIRHLMNCIYCFCPNGSTSDSLVTAYQINNGLIAEGSSEVNSYFINFSDGAPACNVDYTGPKGAKKNLSYSGDAAHMHIAKCRKDIENMGVKVLSYFIGESSESSRSSRTVKQFKEDWGTNNAQFIDVTSVIGLASTLNKMFLSK